MPGGTREAEWIIENCIPPFGMVLMSTIYAKWEFIQEAMWTWIAQWFAVFESGQQEGTCIPREEQFSPLYSALQTDFLNISHDPNTFF